MAAARGTWPTVTRRHKLADTNEVGRLLVQFRESRREFERRVRAVPFERQTWVPPGEAWSVRDLTAQVAAWLAEANDRIPRLLAGAPSVPYDVDEFNRVAVARAASWTAEQTFGAFRRVADRFDVIVGESDPADIAESDDAMQWLRGVAGALMSEHVADLDRLAAALSAGDAEDSARP
jgi:hypothetical protein